MTTKRKPRSKSKDATRMVAYRARIAKEREAERQQLHTLRQDLNTARSEAERMRSLAKSHERDYFKITGDIERLKKEHASELEMREWTHRNELERRSQSADELRDHIDRRENELAKSERKALNWRGWLICGSIAFFVTLFGAGLWSASRIRDLKKEAAQAKSVAKQYRDIAKQREQQLYIHFSMQERAIEALQWFTDSMPQPDTRLTVATEAYLDTSGLWRSFDSGQPLTVKGWRP